MFVRIDEQKPREKIGLTGCIVFVLIAPAEIHYEPDLVVDNDIYEFIYIRTDRKQKKILNRQIDLYFHCKR